MIFDELTKSEVSELEKVQIIAKGINDYRRKIIDTFFPKGIPQSELPFFIAALNLTLKDMKNFAKINNDLDDCMKAAAAAEVITDTLTETISYMGQKGKENG